MKKILTALPALLMLVLPLAASAHQHGTYVIGGTQYDFVIGSLNEPITVDDKTGVDFRVTSGGHMMMADDGDMEPGGGKPAVGLEEKLKVELIAGDKKKTFDLEPVHGTPGSYTAPFYPTVATTLAYRFFGEINGTPVDLTFTCRAEGADAVEEGEKDISTGVKQIMKGGGFGCPSPKENLGFPEQSASVSTLLAGNRGTRGIALAGLALAVVGLVLGGVRMRRRG